MKEIQLTKGKVAIVDDADYEWLNQWKWHAGSGRGTIYALRKSGKRPFMKTICMHRLIMNTPNGMEVDHINMNGLDNRRKNLRNCTRIQNARNVKILSTNHSGYKGVSWSKFANKWSAYINIDGKKSHLGYFCIVQDAARAYDKAAKEFFGEFARTNF